MLLLLPLEHFGTCLDQMFPLKLCPDPIRSCVRPRTVGRSIFATSRNFQYLVEADKKRVEGRDTDVCFAESVFLSF